MTAASRLATGYDDKIEARLSDGATVTVSRDAVQLHDAEGRLLIRYVDGHAEIAAPSGDLLLSAPQGQVKLRSAHDVSIEADRDVVLRGRRTLQLGVDESHALQIKPEGMAMEASAIALKAKTVRVDADSSELVSRHIATVAKRIVTEAEQVEVKAQRIAQKAKDVFTDVQGLLQQRVGRARSVVQGVFTVRSGRTVMESEKDTSIDGERILLG